MPLPLVSADRVLETSTTSGTGPYTLAGAVANYAAFTSIPGLENGSPVSVSVEGFDAGGAPTGYETGIYTWGTGGILTRTAIRSSSNGGNAVNWPATGTRRIAGSLLAGDLNQSRSYRHDPTAQFDNWKVSSALTRARSKPVRVLVTGTSIASFDTSGVRVAAAQLQAVYGRNKTVVNQGGFIGGGWQPTGDLKKQSYPSLPPVRAAFDIGVSRSWSSVVDGFTVVYSTETGGSNLEVRIDGVLVQTINCNAAQSYGNVWQNTFPKSEYHTLTLTATGTGYAPVERVELRDDSPGIFIEDATMGGVGLQHCVNLFVSDANNRAGVATTGTKGIDSVFNRPTAILPDLILQQHFTNDGDDAYDTIKTIMDRAAVTTLAKKTAFVVVTENPALDFVTSAGTLTAGRERMRSLLMSYTDQENIVGIDWIKLMDFSNKTAYEARYFPTADKTHPTAEAYLPLHSAFADLFHMTHPGTPTMTTVAGQAGPDNQKGLNPFAPDAYSLTPLPPGVGRKDQTPFGGLMQSFGLAQNMLAGSVFANVFLSDRVINSSRPQFIDAIYTSTSQDHYGPYVPANLSDTTTVGVVRNVQSVADNDVFTLLILARSKDSAARGEITLFDDETGRNASFMLNAANPGGNAVQFYADGNVPRYYYVSFKRNQTGPVVQYFVKAKFLDVYGLWAVEGTVPVVTSRDKDRAKFLGPPGYMTGDYLWDKVSIGQTYLATLPGRASLMQKTALDTLVVKWLTATKHRLYSVENKADHPVLLVLPISLVNGATLTYNEATGVEEYGDNLVNDGLRVALGGAVVAGEQWTFCMRNCAGYDQGFVRLTGNGVELNLQANGTWTTTATTIGGNDGTKYPTTIAVTFNMPTTAQASSLGANPQFVFNFYGPNYNVTPGTLVRGPSACI